MERLQKVIAESGICSRRKAEQLILDGKVMVDDVVIDTLGFKVDNNNIIKVNGEVIQKEEKVVYIMNKPKNIISSVKDEKNRDTVIDLIDTPYRVFPVGRLDFDSSGLLLLTNDGELTNMMIHPKFHIPKTYIVNIDGVINEETINKLENGVAIDDYVTGEAHIELISTNTNKNKSKLKMTIYEGHNRQIRKMFESVGHTVVKLHRISVANIELENLRAGEYRKLKPHEVLKLRQYLNRDNI